MRWLSSGAMSIRSLPGAESASYQVSTLPLGSVVFWTKVRVSVPLALVSLAHLADQRLAVAGRRVERGGVAASAVASSRNETEHRTSG